MIALVKALGDLGQSEVAKAVLSVSPTEVCAFFRAMPETERRSHAKDAVALLRNLGDLQMDGFRGKGFSRKDSRSLHAWQNNARAAVFATASLMEIKKLGWLAHPRSDGSLTDILGDRRPPWLADWAVWLIDRNPHFFRDIRPLVRAGLCEAPDSDNYVLGLVGLVQFGRDERSIKEALLDDPELLQETLWRLFEVPGFDEHSPAAHDKYLGKKVGTWCDALCALCHDGVLDRDRLLDESLAALGRDFNNFQSRWFAQLHEEMGPTAEERTRRRDGYLALLASPVSSTVGYAVKILAAMQKAGTLPSGALLDGLEPVVLHPSKGHAKKALKMVAGCAKADPGLASRAALIAAGGLEHGDADVQMEAIAVLERLGQSSDAELRSAVEGCLPAVSAVHRARLEAWLGVAEGEVAGGPPAPTPTRRDRDDRVATITDDWAQMVGLPALEAEVAAPKGNIPRLVLDPLQVPRLSDEHRIEPAASLEELIDLSLQALEHSDDVELVDGVIDGAARLHDRRPDDFDRMTAPLVQRWQRAKEALENEFWLAEPALSLLFVLGAWLGRETPELNYDRKDQPFLRLVGRESRQVGSVWEAVSVKRSYYVEHFGVGSVYVLRSAAVAARIAEGKTLPLLSAASHRGGWLAARCLIERSNAWHASGEAMDLADQIIALLRLAPDEREAVRVEAASLPGEWAAALRYALGGDEDIGATAPLWVAASRARCIDTADPNLERAFPKIAMDGGRPAQLGWEVVRRSYGTEDADGPYHCYEMELRCSNPLPKPKSLLPSKQRWLAVDPGKPQLKLAYFPTLLPRYVESFDQRLYRAYDFLGPWASHLWPLWKDAIYAVSARDCGFHMDEARETSDPIPPGYGLLLDPDQEVGPMASLLLAVGLGAGSPKERGLAVDVVIATIEDGRLDGEMLGETMAGLLFSGIIKPKRWQGSLSEVARTSALHRQVVRGALERAIAGEKTVVPQNIGALLELLLELSIECGEAIGTDETRHYLASFKGSSKAAKAAKALLALEERHPAEARKAAALIALEGRIERAERWQARSREA